MRVRHIELLKICIFDNTEPTTIYIWAIVFFFRGHLSKMCCCISIRYLACLIYNRWRNFNQFCFGSRPKQMHSAGISSRCIAATKYWNEHLSKRNDFLDQISSCGMFICKRARLTNHLNAASQQFMRAIKCVAKDRKNGPGANTIIVAKHWRKIIGNRW